MKELIRGASHLVPVVLLVLAMASFQSGASIAKTMFPVVGAAGMVTLRTVLGTMVLAMTMRPWRARIGSKTLRPLLVYGASLGVMNLFFYISLSRIPLGIAVALEFWGPLAVSVVTSRRIVDFGWAFLAAAGILLILPLGRLDTGIDAVGALFALGAGGCWALYIVFGQQAGAHHGAQTVALGSAISAIVVAPFGFVTAGKLLFQPQVLLPGLAIAILSTALPYSLEMFALTRMPARTFGILMSLEPALGALFGLTFLREHLTAVQWTAIALIIMASAGTTLTSERRVAPALAD